MKKLITIILSTLMLLTIGVVNVSAEEKSVSTTDEAQAALDEAIEGDVIVFAEGTYGTLKLRYTGDKEGRTIKNVTIKAAQGATVNVEQITYEKVDGKWLNIEGLIIDGLVFNNPSKTAVWFDYNNDNLLRVDGLTITKCTKIGDKSKSQDGENPYENHTFLGCYHDANSPADPVFAGDNTKKAGYSNIVVSENRIEKVYMPILFSNNDSKDGLTVKDNYFKDCVDNIIQVSGQKNTGNYVITGNTIENIYGRFARIAGVTSDSKSYISNNKLITPIVFDLGDSHDGSDGDGTIIKITGTEGFTVYNEANDWALGNFEPNNTTWKEFAAVAQIDDKKYKSLQAAIAAVPTDNTETTIVMIADELINTNAGVTIDSDKNIVLDLNGYEISGPAPNANNSYVIKIINGGKLRLQDLSTDKTGKIFALATGDNQKLYGNYGVDNQGGTFIMDGGTIECEGVDGGQTGGLYWAVNTGSYAATATTIINGGSLISNSYQPTRIYVQQGGSSSLTINGGFIYSKTKSPISIQLCDNTSNNFSLKINGGTFKTDAGKTPLYVWSYSGTSIDLAESTLQINDGYFTSAGCNRFVEWSSPAEGDGQLTNIPSKYVEDGLFNFVVPDTEIKEGYTCIPNDDETTVMEYPWMIGKRMAMVTPVVIPSEVKGDGTVETKDKQVEKEVKVVDSTPEKIEVAEQIKSTSTNLLPEAEKLSKNGAVLTEEVFKKAAQLTSYDKTNSNERLEVSVNVYLDKQLEEIEKQETVIDSFKVDITPMYIIEATRYLNEEIQGTTVTVTDEPQEIDISRPVVIKMYLPTNFKSSSGAGETQDSVWVKHWLSANESKVYGGTDGFEIKKDANGRYIEFVNPDGFSQFELFLEKVNPNIKPSRKKTRTYVAPVTGD